MVEPTPGMHGVHPIGWNTADAGYDDRTVVVNFWSGIEPCSVLDHVDVAYGVDTVTITLYEGSDPSSGRVACIDIAQYKATTVTLDQPLDGRTLVDGTD
jgi:hypothetical protein